MNNNGENMITLEDIERLGLPSHLSYKQAKRIANTENAYKNSNTDWSKDYWFTVLFKLCKLYNSERYYNKYYKKTLN